jgi:hypothetical protein
LKKFTNQQLGARKNTLLRYKEIIKLFDEKRTENLYMPAEVIHQKFIYPRFFISRVTMYEAFRTPIERDLKEINKIEQSQLQLFA